jgi:RNA polymerase sigma factor (TIGR02999 family)
MDDVTELLQRLGDGDAAAADRLLPLVYAELHRLARHSMAGQPAQTLQPTALVNEAWLRMIAPEAAWPRVSGRNHFLGVAAKAMRSVLVDHARARLAEKRGLGRRGVPLDADRLQVDDAPDKLTNVIALHEALGSLAELDPQLVRVVELRFFAGLSVEETAAVLDVSDRTVKRSWRVARAWLRRELQSGTRES